MSKWRCTLAWRSGSTPPRHGMSRILKAVICDNPHPVPKEIEDAWRDIGPGSGWSIGWELIEQRAVKRWSPEAKARVRKSNLRRRIEKKFPLFADMFIAAAIVERLDYYEGRQ